SSGSRSRRSRGTSAPPATRRSLSASARRSCSVSANGLRPPGAPPRPLPAGGRFRLRLTDDDRRELAADLGDDLRDEERLPGHLVQLDDLDAELVAEQRRELPHVHLRHEDSVEAAEQLAEVRRER